MQYTINQLREELFKPVYDVYAIFQNFFGEDKTDLQGIPTDTELEDTIYITTDIGNARESFDLSPADIERIKSRLIETTSNILVWWPEVTVTNENARSVFIYDLYAKIEIKPDGTIPAENRGFQLNKATYTVKQFTSGYQHSHTPSFHRNSSTPVARWQNPCLGSGPINSTITTLRTDCDEMTWMLFCEELSLYVTVESLAGVPYIKLESIGGTKEDYTFRDYLKDEYITIHHTYSIQPFGTFKNVIKEFILFYLQNGHLSLNYCGNGFVPGMPFYDYIIDLSNNLIAYINKHCTQDQCSDFLQHQVFYRRIIRNGKFMIPDTVSELEVQRYSGVRMLQFKGQQINLRIIPDAPETDDLIVTLINPHIAMFIIQNILRIINYRFTNGHTTNNHSALGISQAATSAPTYQTVIYL